MRIEVVRLGAGGVHARALQLLDDEAGAAAGQRAFCSNVGRFQNGAGERHARGEAEGGAVGVRRRIRGVGVLAGVDQEHFVEPMRAPVVGHARVVPQGHHAVVLLRITVPHQHRQVVGDVRVGGGEVLERAHDVGLAQAAVADGDGEQLVAIEIGAGHGEVLALAQGTRGRQEAGDRARQVAQQAVTLAVARAHVGNGMDAHVFQRGVEEHRRVEAGRMVADLGHHVAVAQQMQRGHRVGAGGEAARVAGRLAAGDLQGQVAQRVGGQQGLIDRRLAACVWQRGLVRPQERRGAEAVDFREAVGEILDAFAEGREGLGGLCQRVHGHSFFII